MCSLTMRRAAIGIAATLGVAGCADNGPGITGPASSPSVTRPSTADLELAVRAQQRHTEALLQVPGVVGTAVGRLPNGRTGIRVFVASANTRGVPRSIDGVPVETEVTGLFMALSDPTTRQRPAPLGFSVGHPAITAGTLGARVVGPTGIVYILSNNHVLANSNGATVGDATLQPGAFDGGTAGRPDRYAGCVSAHRVLRHRDEHDGRGARAGGRERHRFRNAERRRLRPRQGPQSSEMPTATGSSTTATHCSAWPSRNTGARPSSRREPLPASTRR